MASDPTQTTAPPQYLTRDQVHALISAAKPGRDRLFIRVAWETGARVGEILNLLPSDVVCTAEEEGTALGEAYGLILGHVGTDARFVPVGNSLSTDLEDWIEGIPQIHELPEKFLFQFNRHSAWRMVKQAGIDAGIVYEDGRNVTPDALRHSFAMNCILQDVPIGVVQQIMGITPLRAQMYSAAASPERVREFLRKVEF